jgi:3-hydroxybutyryl-CoA dehydratase
MKKGDTFSHEFAVDERTYRGFIELFGDRNPLHTDAAFARSKGFAAEVMHGNILGGFLSFFVGECLPIKNVIIHDQQISFLKPISLNDKLQFTAVVRDVFDSVGVVELGFEFASETGVRLAKGKVSIGVLP